MLYYVSRFVFFLTLKAFFRFRVSGKENIPERGGAIIASNHVSFLDPPALGCACPRKVYFLARDTLYRNKIFAFWANSVGVVPIKRGAGDIAALRAALRIIRKGRVIAMFPQGTRAVAGKEPRAQAGIGFLAAKLDVPVIPAFIKGTDEVLPKPSKKINFRKISVHFGKPIIFEKGLSYQEIADIIMDSIRGLS